MKTLVVRKVINGCSLKLRLVRVGPGVISQGVMKLEQVRVICPACGQQIEAVARDGQVKGYCAVAKQFVDFPIETQRVPTGKNHTGETKAKMSAATKKLWQDPDYRARQSAILKKLWQDPEYRAKQIAARTGKDNAAEFRARQSAILKKRWQDPEYRAKQIAAHSATSKKPWQDPDYRARQSAILKKLWQDPEYRAKQIAAHSATSKKPWQDPDYRARHSAGTKKLWQDPEYQAKQIATRTGKHPTAKTKAKISAALKRRHNNERKPRQ